MFRFCCADAMASSPSFLPDYTDRIFSDRSLPSPMKPDADVAAYGEGLRPVAAPKTITANLVEIVRRKMPSSVLPDGNLR